MLFVLPALALFAVFRFVPLAGAGLLSLTDYRLGGGWSLVGLDNYRRLLADPALRASLRVTAVYVAWYVPLTVLPAVAVAVMLHAARWGHGFLRTVFVLPYLTSTVLAAVLWRAVYEVEDGLLNTVLGALGAAGPDFLGSTALVLPSLALASAWKGFGYSMLILLAGLTRIPAEYTEAALLDGAGGWQRFRHVTLPLLRPVLAFVLVVETIAGCQLFDMVYVLTSGGPAQASHSLVYALYQDGFAFLGLGYASAIGVAFFALVFAVSVTQWRLLRRRPA
jgi:multiple sugar transport system permease protein